MKEIFLNICSARSVKEYLNAFALDSDEFEKTLSSNHNTLLVHMPALKLLIMKFPLDFMQSLILWLNRLVILIHLLYCVLLLTTGYEINIKTVLVLLILRRINLNKR